MNKQLTAAVLGGALTAAALSGCSINEHTGHGNGSPGQSQHSENGQHSGHGAQPSADVSFAQGMIPHHQQALDMSRLAAQRASSPEIRDLAARIEAAQAPEIDEFTRMLHQWGVHDTGAHQHMDGMVSPEQLGELGAAAGPDFDHRFLLLMIAHHEGAVRMAETELTTGKDPQARRLAENIIGSQREEIDTMRALLGR